MKSVIRDRTVCPSGVSTDDCYSLIWCRRVEVHRGPVEEVFQTGLTGEFEDQETPTRGIEP